MLYFKMIVILVFAAAVGMSLYVGIDNHNNRDENLLYKCVETTYIAVDTKGKILNIYNCED